MQRPRTPSRISDSLHHQLNMYAIAAGAAGVSVLALMQPADAKIVYTPTHHVIGENEKYSLALDHKNANFIIANSRCIGGSAGCTSWSVARLTASQASTRWTSGNQVVGPHSSGIGRVSALRKGARISKGRSFVRFGYMEREFRQTSTTLWGDWDNVTGRYLGLKFKIGGEFHYGWARLNVRVLKKELDINTTLTGYAYETIPNKPIIAGKTKGPDVTTAKDVSLGHLARGSSAIPAWRPKGR
jgi:hypothetical protein